MDTTINRVTGENGAPALATTSSKLVDLFFQLVRGLDGAALSESFASAAKECKTPSEYAELVVLAFQTRSCRSDGAGKGEKDLFYLLLAEIAKAFGEDVVKAVLPLVSSYGYWKDLLAICEYVTEGIADAALAQFSEALTADEVELAAATKEKRTPKLSLAGKWAPRENSAFDKKMKLATKLALKMYGSANKPQAQRKYRKLIASLNTALNTTEVLMAAGRWEEIKFAAVASKCLQMHRKAFLNETVKGKVGYDEEETGNRHPESEGRVASRKALRAAMASKSVKGKQLQPHEIASKCMSMGYGYGRSSGLSTAEKDLMDAQWSSLRAGIIAALEKAAAEREAEVLAAAAPMKTAAAASGAGGLGSVAALKAALPKTVDLGKLVPLIDVSGSMHGQPMEVAIGMGILVSEMTHAAFKNRCLTFESKPAWVDLSSCKTICEKVNKVQSAGWGGSTDFEAACERILMAAEKAKLTPDEIPDLIVFSDMQFNQAGCLRGAADYYNYGRKSYPTWETHYERLERRFAEVGQKVCGSPYAPPKIIFWNLRANTVGFPVEADAPNTMLLSGFSPALLKLILTGSELGVVVEEEEAVVDADGKVKAVKRSGPTPAETVRKALDDSAYDPVRVKLSELETGVFAEYSFAKEDAGFELVDVM